MNPTQLVSQKLTCLFETGKPELSVATVEDLGDGRGYTCGWAGFTTADEEVVECVEEYTRAIPNNELAPLLGELKRLKAEGSDDTSKLDALDFKTHWENASSTDEFQAAYASVVDRLFGHPARLHLNELGLQLPAAHAVLFDSVIQHGNDSDPDGVPAMLERTKASAGEPTQDEAAWLQSFLEVRKHTLQNPHNKETASAWRESVSRVEALGNIVGENPDLQTPVKVESSEHDETIE